MVIRTGPLQSYIVRCRCGASKLTKAPHVTRLDFSTLSLLRRDYCTVGLYSRRCHLSQPSLDVSDVCLESLVIVTADSISSVFVLLRLDVAVSRRLSEVPPVVFRTGRI